MTQCERAIYSVPTLFLRYFDDNFTTSVHIDAFHNFHRHLKQRFTEPNTCRKMTLLILHSTTIHPTQFRTTLTRRVQFDCEKSDILVRNEVKLRQSMHRESRDTHYTLTSTCPTIKQYVLQNETVSRKGAVLRVRGGCTVLQKGAVSRNLSKFKQ